jgi:hypothetical protein
MPITKGQLVRLQILYQQLAHHELGMGLSREERVAWASARLHKPVKSFSDLSREEAGWLIDQIQTYLGVKVPARPRKRLDRDAAHRAGTEGRRSDPGRQSTLAGKAEVARIHYVLDVLGWNEQQLEAWLRSSRSPLAHNATPVIRTLGDANRVWWALKRMAKARGLWKERA